MINEKITSIFSSSSLDFMSNPSSSDLVSSSKTSATSFSIAASFTELVDSFSKSSSRAWINDDLIEWMTFCATDTYLLKYYYQ